MEIYETLATRPMCFEVIRPEGQLPGLALMRPIHTIGVMPDCHDYFNKKHF